MSWRHNADSTVRTIPEVAPATPPGDAGSPPPSKWRTLLVVAVFVALIGGIVAVVVESPLGERQQPGQCGYDRVATSPTNDAGPFWDGHSASPGQHGGGLGCHRSQHRGLR